MRIAAPNLTGLIQPSLSRAGLIAPVKQQHAQHRLECTTIIML
jgi:hypothetical protein